MIIFVLVFWLTFMEIYRIMAAENVLFDGGADYTVVALIALLLALLLAWLNSQGYLRVRR